MNATVTMGGLVVGLILLMREFLPVVWPMIAKRGGGSFRTDSGEGHVPGRFDLRAHLPFLGGLVIGMLAISAPGGIIGTIAARILGLSNTLGDKALATGTGSAATAVTRHAATQITPAGAVVTLLLIAGVIILRKTLPKPARRQLFAGIWCGITLGLSSGAAGLTGSVLIPAANQLGQALGGAV
jgi:hypothetical protein